MVRAGGPVIEMKYGRKDADKPEDCVDEGNLPAGNAPFPDSDTPQAWSSFSINLYCFLFHVSVFYVPMRAVLVFHVPLGPFSRAKARMDVTPGDKTLLPPS